MKLFGLAGTAGSGKDTVAELICEMFDMHNYSTSDFVRACTRFLFDLSPEASPIRDQLFMVATQLRELNQATTVQMGVLQAKERGIERQIISGIRSIGEMKALKDAGGIMIAVDADPYVRHQRITSRARDAESKRTFDEFLKQDTYENEGVAKGDMRGIRYVIEESDIVITNEASLEDLKNQIKTKISQYL